MTQGEFLQIRTHLEIILRHTERLDRFARDTFKDTLWLRRSNFILGGLFYTMSLIQAFQVLNGVDYFFLAVTTTISVLFLWMGFGSKDSLVFWANAVNAEAAELEKIRTEISLLEIEYANQL